MVLGDETSPRLLALHLGSYPCLQAVGTGCGLIGGDCAPVPQLVGAACELETPLVCGFGRGCLQAAIHSEVILHDARI